MRSSFLVLSAAAALIVSPAAASADSMSGMTPAQRVSPAVLVTRIDLNCKVVAQAIKSQQPTAVVALRTTRWVPSKSDATLSEAGSGNAYAKVWKQAGNYVWVDWVSRDSHGARRVDQLCYRNDGTLARVRQATSLPALDAASARVAYFNVDGSPIKQVGVFVIDDAAKSKRVQQLPFYKALP